MRRIADTYLSDASDGERALIVTADVSHSYLTLVTRSEKLAKLIETQAKVDSMSISGVIETADDQIVLGLRGGFTYSDTFMTVPAGSIDYHSGRNPLFETFDAEVGEEVGLSDLSDVRVLGRIYDFTLGNNSHYVFGARTPLTFGEAATVYKGALENREHRHLMGIANDGELILNLAARLRFDRSVMDKERPSVTVAANRGSMLPPAVAGLLLYYRSKVNPGDVSNWVRDVEKTFRGEYTFL